MSRSTLFIKTNLRPLLYGLFVLSGLFILNACESPANSPQKQLAVLLDEGDLALQEDRLTIPEENNAYYFYSQALSLSPAHPRALEGLESIQARYLELAEQALKQKNITKAKNMLKRAEKVLPATLESKALRTKISLTEKRKKQKTGTKKNKAAPKEEGVKYMLSISDLNAKNRNIRKRLLLIGEHAAQTQSKVIIDARNQEEAEWIYKQVQYGATGHQLRKEFRISLYPHIVVLTKPE